MDPLKSEFLASMTAGLDVPQVVGPTPDGVRMIYYVTGGTIEGPKIKGKVLPGGGDWLRLRADGISVLDVRATIETDDGALIYAHYPGYITASVELFARIQAGEEIDPSQYYFRTAPRFETAASRYAELNSLICVGVGRLGPSRVSYSIYAIR
jgi:hypothetical protein